jgi:hypothetical protein
MVYIYKQLFRQLRQLKNNNMKKYPFIITALTALLFMAILVITPLNARSQKQTSLTSFSFPENVATILRTSCISCHGEGGNAIASTSWNFNKWETYTTEKQSKKANDICDAITKEKMPPSSIKKSNPEQIPTLTQMETICKWANSYKTQ